MSDGPQNAMGSSAPARWDCLVSPLVPPRPPMALARPCTGGDAAPPSPGTDLGAEEQGRAAG